MSATGASSVRGVVLVAEGSSVEIGVILGMSVSRLFVVRMV